mgnify:CR=1 FL=1
MWGEAEVGGLWHIGGEVVVFGGALQLVESIAYSVFVQNNMVALCCGLC